MALLLPPKIIYYSLFLACLLTILHFFQTTAAPLRYICGITGNYTTGSTFQTNLKNLLSSLSSGTPASGYTNGTYGSIPDRVYGLSLCRGDVAANDCQSCVNTATQDILQLCPYTQSAAVWYDYCFLRYSNQVFFASTDVLLHLCMCVRINATQPHQFEQRLRELMKAIFRHAAYNSSTSLFATGEVIFTASQTIYGLVQCTKDLSTDDCYQCLQWKSCCSGHIGRIVMSFNCNYGFRVYRFYEGASKVVLRLPPITSVVAQSGVPPPSTATGLVLAITIPVAAAMVLTFILCICLCRRRSKKKLPFEVHTEEIVSIESLYFDLSTIKVATDNFSESNKLGQGGFGAVYKGLLPDGREIAVKRLSTNSMQGVGELKNELVLVAKLQHRNLVRLLGVCLEEQERLLVYEYVPNRSLDTLLFDPTRSAQLHWDRRYSIIGGIARGLQYLHEDSQLKIVHRDLKASNILLDADMNPKISDFGLARIFAVDQTKADTGRVVGTFGYMAPEYVRHGRLSIKCDVFSFGILILEIITGKRNTASADSGQTTNLTSYIWEHWTNGTINEIIDPSLREHYPFPQVECCIQIGLLCAQENSAGRPNMSTVVVMLNSHSMTLQAPSQPGYLFCSSEMNSDVLLCNRAAPLATNELSITELEAR